MGRKIKKGLTMEDIRDILHMKLQCGLGIREIGRTLKRSHSTISECVNAAEEAGLTPEIIRQLSDEELITLLRPKNQITRRDSQRTLPDCEYIQKELRKKHVTLSLLWQEYKEEHGEAGYQLTQFCKYYRRWLKKQPLSMRQSHKSGEKLFVDYAGTTIPITDRKTGGIKHAQIFIGVLGASNYTFVEATLDQSLRSWINSHIHAFEFFGGVPHCIVPDNLKAGVIKASFYEPTINRTYQSLAEHYDTAILPTRVCKPKDKAKVEGGVLIISRWIIAALRNRTFYSLEELNDAIALLREKLNHKKMQKRKESRHELFFSEEKESLKLLPEERFVYAEWKKARASIDYHVEYDKHYYSVPYKLRGELLQVKATTQRIEIFYNFKKIATHMRSFIPHRHTTIKDHMPDAHRSISEWSPSRMINWGSAIGPCTKQVIEIMLNKRRYPEQNYRACLGILRLAKRYSDQRLERACQRACEFGSYSRRSIQSILTCNLDGKPTHPTEHPYSINHTNIRGAHYFTAKEVLS